MAIVGGVQNSLLEGLWLVLPPLQSSALHCSTNMSASIGNLLSSANITSSVNVEAFLSSEYDSDGGDTLGQSLEQSGDFLSSEPPTPGIRTSAQLTQKGVEILGARARAAKGAPA